MFKLIRHIEKDGANFLLVQSIEGVYFIFIDTKMINNSLDLKEAYHYYSIALGSYKIKGD